MTIWMVLGYDSDDNISEIIAVLATEDEAMRVARHMVATGSQYIRVKESFVCSEMQLGWKVAAHGEEPLRTFSIDPVALPKTSSAGCFQSAEDAMSSELGVGGSNPSARASLLNLNPFCEREDSLTKCAKKCATLEGA